MHWGIWYIRIYYTLYVYLAYWYTYYNYIMYIYSIWTITDYYLIIDIIVQHQGHRPRYQLEKTHIQLHLDIHIHTFEDQAKKVAVNFHQLWKPYKQTADHRSATKSCNYGTCRCLWATDPYHWNVHWQFNAKTIPLASMGGVAYIYIFIHT